jgi:translation initiation factor 2 gamma subunit (eIF-2gamma)
MISLEKKQSLINMAKSNLTQNEATLRKLQATLEKDNQVRDFLYKTFPNNEDTLEEADQLVANVERLIEQVEDLLISCAENLRNVEALEVDE